MRTALSAHSAHSAQPTPPARGSQLALAGVTKRYDDRVVLDRVSFTVKPGEKVGVVGDNGSGKSTLLKLLAGHERPDNGELTVVAPGASATCPRRWTSLRRRPWATPSAWPWPISATSRPGSGGPRPN
nr:hypothetical protein GCM10020093_107180 [Planobispora longispora]